MDGAAHRQWTGDPPPDPPRLTGAADRLREWRRGTLESQHTAHERPDNPAATSPRRGALDVEGGATVLAGWDPDATFWLADVLEPAGEPVAWERVPGPDRWRPRS